MRRLRRSPRLTLPSLCRHRFPRRLAKGRLPQLHPRAVLGLVLFAAVFVLLCIFLDARARPKISALTEITAKQQAITAITQAVEQVLLEEKVSYERLVDLRTEGETIRSIETNALEINLVKGKINAAVEKAVALRNAKLRLPLGALLGSDLFAGAGPKITVPLTMTGHALSDVHSDLVSSGVNQTMHRILLSLHVTLSVILPDKIATAEVETTVCLAETVIVGSVPNGLITQK
ncbi:MAG: sporulation protein YunB [Oscillospiraceae bacterium]|jgi:sporulation protein YunB|nr:sporulation protein YunB [Oscillospiraceae bacterium]